MNISNQKNQPYDIRGSTPKLATGGGAHHRGSRPRLHSSEETCRGTEPLAALRPI